jgi:hypothetical protein
MRRSVVSVLIVLAILAAPAAALCASCCAPPIEKEMAIGPESCCGCDETMAPAPSVESLAASKAPLPIVLSSALLLPTSRASDGSAVAAAFLSPVVPPRTAPAPRRL